jgi:ribosome-associated protein
MIEINSKLAIDDNEIQFDFVRASGPGGQNVNKVATSVQLRFDVRNSPSLDAEVKERLIKLAGSRVTEDGVLIIEAKRYRTQEQNRFDAVQRLTGMIQKALVRPKPRKATRPSITARAARLADKKKRSQTKRIRKYDPGEWE